MKRNTISTAGQAPVEPKSDRLCHALAHAANGFRVFPLKPNGKTPLVKAWQKIATTDEGQIRAWWKQWPDANIAIATGDWLLVVDADCKNDQPGLQSLIMLQVEYEIPGDNYEVNTPTGGKHVYLEIENDPRIRNSAGSIEEYPGIDIRCNGGYVVAAGSVLDAGEYTQNDQPVNRCPSGIADIARRSCGRPGKSYARKLLTVISGGVFDLLDPLLERHSIDEFGEVA